MLMQGAKQDGHTSGSRGFGDMRKGQKQTKTRPQSRSKRHGPQSWKAQAHLRGWNGQLLHLHGRPHLHGSQHAMAPIAMAKLGNASRALGGHTTSLGQI